MKKVRTAASMAARTVALITALGVVALWGAAAASAHVTVAAPGVVVGDSDATIIFRVPTESATAKTVELKVQLPTTMPLAGVLVAPVPGWTSTITNTTLTKPITTDDGTITEVVSQIDWKADSSSGIQPGYFGQFPILVGKLPDDVSTLTFKAIQTYSDARQVAWIEIPATGSTAEPDHPAPVLTLTRPAVAASGSSPATSSPVVASPTMTMPMASPATTSTAAATKGAATSGIVLGAIGVLLGAAALCLSLLRRRRTPDSP